MMLLVIKVSPVKGREWIKSVINSKYRKTK
jgi:hypothetical protein